MNGAELKAPMFSTEEAMDLFATTKDSFITNVSSKELAAEYENESVISTTSSAAFKNSKIDSSEKPKTFVLTA